MAQTSDTRREAPSKYSYQSSKYYDSKDHESSRDRPHHASSYRRDYYPPTSSTAYYRDERESYHRKEYRDEHPSSSVTIRYSAAQSRVDSYSKDGGEKRM